MRSSPSPEFHARASRSSHARENVPLPDRSRRPMRTLRALRAALVVPALALANGPLAHASPATDVRINEIRIDQPSVDNDEYFELTGTPGESLDGLTYLVIGDGTAAQGSGVIEAVIPLTGKSIPADGYFLCTEGTFTLRPLATVDFVASGSNPLK